MAFQHQGERLRLPDLVRGHGHAVWRAYAGAVFFLLLILSLLSLARYRGRARSTANKRWARARPARQPSLLPPAAAPRLLTKPARALLSLRPALSLLRPAQGKSAHNLLSMGPAQGEP